MENEHLTRTLLRQATQRSLSTKDNRLTFRRLEVLLE